MSRVTVVPPRAGEGPTAPASSYDVGQKVRAAAWAGGFVAMGLAVVASVACLPGGFWQAWLWAVAGSLVAGVVVTCWLGCRWVVAAASRSWSVDDRIRQRVWEMEDQERKAREAAQAAAVALARDDVEREGGLDGNPATLDQAQLLHLVAVEVLRRHYVRGEKVTRDAMEAAGLCTQGQWNLVNQALLAVGLKEKKTMQAGLDFAQAWEIWRASVRIGEDGYLWILNSRGSWKALVKVT